MTNRLFISLELPEEIIYKVINIRDDIYHDKQKIPSWEKADKLHITLRFLGDTESSKISSISSIIKLNSGIIKSSASSLGKFGMFFRKKQPAILWLGVYLDKSIYEFVDVINEKLVELGFEKEKRPFKPHLTLLRIKGRENQELLKKFLDYEMGKINFNFNSISLMKSELKPSGSVYTKIERLELL